MEPRAAQRLIFFFKVKIQWIGLRENLQETQGFLPSNIGLKPVNFPITQFYERYKVMLLSLVSWLLKPRLTQLTGIYHDISTPFYGQV
jgi:hypothetical protein